jgi:hypothetical protein
LGTHVFCAILYSQLSLRTPSALRPPRTYSEPPRMAEAAPPRACGMGARLVSNVSAAGSYSQTCDWALVTDPVL